MNDVVLVLGSPEDEHALYVAEAVRARGLAVHWLEGREFPQDLEIAVDADSDGQLVIAGERLAFSQIRSVYWRRYHAPVWPELTNPEQADLAATDSACLWHALLIELPARWVNGWAGFQTHQCKPAALARVKRLGLTHLRTPQTLHSNSPEGIAAFASRVGRCIFKPVHGGAHTRPLTDRHLSPKNLEVLRQSPVTIQERIEGTDIRVFVAGERVLACAVRSDALDFRDDPDPTIEAIELPGAIADECRQVAEALDLIWTGIDLRQEPGGDYVFFEANPSPMFLGFEDRCGLPITEALVDLLTP